MVLNFPEAVIGASTFAENDRLGRKPLGDKLASLCVRIHQPLVIVLDGGWGSGKTHFLKIWLSEHNTPESGMRCIYFDAFEHDYISDPLAALVMALERGISDDDPSSRKHIRKLKAISKRVVFPLVRIAGSVGTLGASNAVVDGVKAVVDELDDVAEAIWSEEEARFEAIKKFRRTLSKLASEKKIVFIVDELDRCRPDFALRVLEIVKHFFKEAGMHFILGANLDSLQNSVKSRYGSEIDSELYLQKFISFVVEFSDSKGGSDLAGYLDFIEQEMVGRGDLLSGRAAAVQFLREVVALPSFRDAMSLRSIQRVLSRIVLFPEEFAQAKWPEVRICVICAVLEVVRRGDYQQLSKGNLDPERIRYWANAGPRASEDLRILSREVSDMCNALCGLGVSDQFRGELEHMYTGVAKGPRLQYFLRNMIHQNFDALSFVSSEHS